MKTILRIFLACALFCAAGVRAQQTPPSGAALIAVSKESMTLAVYDFNSRRWPSTPSPAAGRWATRRSRAT